MPDDAWELAARVVRPYLLTRGRTRSETRNLGVSTMLSAARRGEDGLDRLAPEQRQIVDVCREPRSVAEVAAKLATPLGVVRVLVADLADDAWLEVFEPARDLAADVHLLQRLIARVKAIPL
jgi:hypothetical protein